jgi:hypothetical protein
MTERDIQGHVTAFIEAMDKDDEPTAKRAFAVLLSTALVDLHRIADALEAMAAKRT